MNSSAMYRRPAFSTSSLLQCTPVRQPPLKRCHAVHACLRPISRKHFLRLIPALACCNGLLALPTNALPTLFSTAPDLIERLGEKAPLIPSSQRFQPDLYYPTSFRGVWKVHSTLYSSTKNDTEPALDYLARFIVMDEHSIADRAYNMASIASAAMGPQAVLSVIARLDNPDRCEMSLMPVTGGGNVYNASIKVLARNQQTGELPTELGGGQAFLTSETVRQVVTLEGGAGSGSEKVIEITCSFPLDAGDTMTGWQRTCTYERGKTRPSDVRVYQIQYERY